MFEGLIFWLDAEKWLYWLVALIATAAWIAAVIAPVKQRKGAVLPRSLESGWQTLLWFIITIVLLLAWRWPYIVGPHILNPDESQMIAGAITLKEFPVFWKYVDGTTHGPLADIPLLVGNLFGVPLNYGGARFIAGALILGGMTIAGRGFMHRYQPQAIRIGLAPAMFLEASIAYYDFTGYMSETMPLFLILTSIGLLVPVFSRDRDAEWRLFARCCLVGTCLGSIPYAKLQGVPVGLMIGVIAVVAILAHVRSLFGRKALLAAGACVAGALIPTAVVGVHLWIWGLWRQFLITYIDNNLVYTSAVTKPHAQLLAEIWPHMYAAPGLHTLAWVTASIVIAAVAITTLPMRIQCLNTRSSETAAVQLTVSLSRWNAGARWMTVAWIFFAASSVAALISPGRQYGHYLQFLLPPLALFPAIWLGELAENRTVTSLSPRTRARALPVLAALAVTPLAIARACRADPEMHGLWTRNHGEWRSPAGLAIKALARPGDTLSVWGWMPYFHVEANLPQATREAHTYGQITLTPLRDFYRERFMRDFKRSSPRIFVDAAGGENFGFNDRAMFGHETFPPLAAIIAEHYELVDDVAGSRIYLRRE